MIRTYQETSPTLERDVYVAPSADIIGRVTLKEEANIWYGTVIRGDDNQVVVGRRTNIQDNCTLHIALDDPCIVGDDVTVGHGAIIHACTVGDRVLVGMGAILLNGCEIGEETIIAAGSVITPGTKIPPRSMVMGTPGKVIRKLKDEEVEAIVQSAKAYVELARKHEESKGGELDEAL